MEIAVFNKTGQDTGRKVNLDSNIFEVEPNDHAIYLDVKQFLANQRQGTAKSKQRNEVSGSTKKIHRQKGTGGARHGSRKAPVFVGGGRIFGPQPRDYGFKLNKKVKRLARVSALSYKAKENGLTVIENFEMEKPGTKAFNTIIKGLSLNMKRALFVIPELNKNLYLSARNLPKAKVLPATELNTYEILKAQQLVVFEGALPVIEKTLTKS
ncbi:MAG: 50S ribosomal protein L4 [Bacteroidia bacterium]|nr:50S ribosomal protein L4 [Bacteroidia bacterium]MCZ2278258.1 50S ribosomal protein L4 [Bacteroidia bacterium]